MSTRQPEVRTALPRAPPLKREGQSGVEHVGQHFLGAEPGEELREAASAPREVFQRLLPPPVPDSELGRGPRPLPRRPWEPRPWRVGLQRLRGRAPWIVRSNLQ